jgi:hypothetical protein
MPGPCYGKLASRQIPRPPRADLAPPRVGMICPAMGRQRPVRSVLPTSNGGSVFKSAEEQRQREAFLATPIGAATAAREAGRPFFEIQLEVGGHTGNAGFGSIGGRRTTSSSAVTLGEIEKLGWHLEHASYYFMITGETSTNRAFVSGQATAVSGITVGVYLFRNTTLAEPSS